MAIIKPPVLPAWADAGDKTQPTNTEIDAGWPASAVPPSRQRFNWVLNFCANAVRYFSRFGIAEYDAAETYPLNGKCLGSDGNTYISRVASNINNNPVSSPTQWKLWATSSTADVTGMADNNEKLVTTAWAKFGFAVLLASNGYLKLPDWLGGVIFQWGGANITAIGYAGVSFPLVFPNAALQVVLTDGAGSLAQTHVISLDIINNLMNPNGFWCYGALPTTQAAAATNVRWIAVGY